MKYTYVFEILQTHNDNIIISSYNDVFFFFPQLILKTLCYLLKYFNHILVFERTFVEYDHIKTRQLGLKSKI